MALGARRKPWLNRSTRKLELAGECRRLRGVVGWAPIPDDDFPGHLEKLLIFPKLKGLRHVLQNEPDDSYMLRPDFGRGLSALRHTPLVYDILIYRRQLPFAAQLTVP